MDRLLNIFKKIILCREFEKNVAKAIKDKYITIPVYLSTGQEIVPCILSEFIINTNIFPQHRCHSYYIAYGFDTELLAKELLSRPDGLNNGYGGSASIHVKSTNVNIFGHSGLLGDQLAIAAGFTHGSGQPSVVQLGDASVEEDFVLGAFGYIASKNLPILMICEDNNLSILTKKIVRRNWDICRVVSGFGIDVATCSYNNEGLFYVTNIIRELSKCINKPRFVNIDVCRHMWHAGGGTDGLPEFDYLTDFKDFLIGSRGQSIVSDIENKIRIEQTDLWTRLLNESKN